MFYNYLFYSIYKFTLKTPRKDDPVFITVFMMILPIGANISAVYLIFEKMLLLPELTDFAMGGLALSTVLINYLVYWRKDRYKQIIEKIESHSMAKRRRWKSIIILYFIMTVILYFTVAYTSDYIASIL